MKRYFPLLLLISLLWMVKPTQAQNDASLEERTIAVDGLERSYVLFVPPSYDGSSPVPLVFVLHGGGGNPLRFVLLTRMNEIARKENFIVVYAAGTGGLRRADALTWNAGYCCAYAYASQVDDVAYFRAMVDSLSAEFNIDPSRIFATGHSNGGMMSYRLAAEMSDVFAAVGVSAGTVGGYAKGQDLFTIPEPQHPVSIIHIHGTADVNVMYNGGQNGLRTSEGRVDLAAADSIAFWVSANQCDTPADSLTSEDGKVITDTYACPATGTTVKFVTVVGGGHTWYSERADTPADQRISTTDEVWDFFKAHPKAP